MKRTLRRIRVGFSLMEILTAIAVIAVIAAILVSNDNPETGNDRARYDAAADALNNVAQAIAATDPTKPPRSFHQVVNVYPGKLSDLTTPITTAGTNICGNAYTGPATTVGTNMYKWNNAANPFYGSQLLTAGTPIAPGFTVQDALIRLNAVNTSGTGSLANTMIIRMPSVTQADAQGLDLLVDGLIDGTTGIIRYTASDPTVVDYYITITVGGFGGGTC
jgi:prepilin-type N-terminal cleavage/methylation domain-containing protein